MSINVTFNIAYIPIKLHSFLALVQLFTYSDTCAPVATSQPVVVAVGVVLGLIMCGSCLLAGVWWKRRYYNCNIYCFVLFKNLVNFFVHLAHALIEIDFITHVLSLDIKS